MKAIFSRQTLLNGLSLVQNLVGTSGALPILSNVLFSADKDGARLVATDLECFVEVKIEGTIEEGGRVTAPARTLLEIVRLLPEDNIALVTSGTRMTLTCNRNVYHLSTMNADDYPEWPSIDPMLAFSVKQADFNRALKNTLFAIPARDPRKVLMGCLFEVAGGKLTCVSTDGRKLGKAVIDTSSPKGKKEFHGIVPGRVLQEIQRAMSEEGDIRIELTDQRAVLKVPSLNLTFLTSLIEGKYPAYDSVIPETFKRDIELPKVVVDEAIGRAAILAERKHHSIVMSFDENVIQIRSQSFEDGSYEGQVEVDYTHEPFKIAFNYHYLHEVLRVAPDKTIIMKVKDSSSPVVFQCESDPDSLYLVMPVRIHELESESEEAPPAEKVKV
jgi:DNA polymerase III subunit beta